MERPVAVEPGQVAGTLAADETPPIRADLGVAGVDGPQHRLMRSGWLVRDGDVLASADIAETRGERRRGLIGAASVEGALVLRPCRHVHTIGMRIPIDVALCADDGRVLHVETLKPWRVSSMVRGTRWVVEARSGAFDAWRVRAGDVLEVKE